MREETEKKEMEHILEEVRKQVDMVYEFLKELNERVARLSDSVTRAYLLYRREKTKRCKR